MQSSIDLTVILPTYNERENPGFWNLIDDIKKLEFKPQIIVVDDGDDLLWENLPEDIKYLRGKKGESESIEFALWHVDTKYVTIMDSDGSHPVDFIEHSYKEIKENENQILVGSRYEKEGGSNATYINRTVSRISNKFANWALGKSKISSDLTGRLFTSTREIFLSYDVWYGRGDSAIALLYKAKKENINVKDIPITYTRRTAGSGSTDSLKGIIKYLILYFIRVFSVRLDEHKPFSDRWIERSKHDWSNEDYKISYRTMVLACLIIPIYFFIRLSCRIPGMGGIIINYPSNSIGFIFRSAYWKNKFQICGQDILIGRNTEFFHPEKIIIDNRVIIDNDVTLIAPGYENFFVYIENEVTIHSNSYLNLKGGGWLKEKSCVGHGCQIFTHTNIPGGSFSYATRPHEQIIVSNPLDVMFRLGKNSFIGTNSTIISSQIEDDVVIGAHSFVRENKTHTGIKLETKQLPIVSRAITEISERSSRV